MTGDTFSTQLDAVAATLLRRVEHYRELGDTKLALAADIAAEGVLALLDALPLAVSEGSTESEAA